MMATARLSRLLAAASLLLIARADPPHRYHRSERPDPHRAAVPFHTAQQGRAESGAAVPRGPLPDPPDACADNGAEGTCGAPLTSNNDDLPAGDRYFLETDVNRGYYLFGSRDCFRDGTAPSSLSGDFVAPILAPGDVAPFLWRDTGKIATQYALQIGLPPTLTSALWSYASELGIPELLGEYASTSNEEGDGEFLGPEVGTGRELWYLQYPSQGQSNKVYSVGPADEIAHEECLRTLAAGDFDSVLESVGTMLGADSLAVYQVAFYGIGRGDGLVPQVVSSDTRGGAHKLLVPLSLAENDALELVLWDDKEDRSGMWKHRVGTGILLGDGARHAVGRFDDSEIGSGMSLFAAIHVAEIYDKNAAAIAEETLHHAFPQKDGYERAWLLANEARHWQKDEGGRNRLAGDVGRKAFRSDDESEVCDDLADDGGCEDLPTRRRCPLSCRVYVQEGPTRVEPVDGDADGVNVCVQNRTGAESCRLYEDTPTLGDFVTPTLSPGEMFPFVWRDDKTVAVPWAFLVGLPPELTSALLEYCDMLGLTEAMRGLTGDEPLDPGSSTFVELSDGNDWYVQRPPSKWTSNMHWISPGDETTHEEYLKVLARGNFDVVLDAIGSYLGLESLAAYHLTFIGVSHSDKGFMHRDTHHTGASVYNVIIPLILEDDTPELAMADDLPPYEVGALKYRLGTGAMMGDDSMHGTEGCDYRARKGMRLAATVYIADIKESNAKKIATQTLTQIFPMRDDRWLMAQAGRHWNGNDGDASLANDKGRGPFQFEDGLEDCEERAAEGLCYEDDGGEKGYRTRRSCQKSCLVYCMTAMCETDVKEKDENNAEDVVEEEEEEDETFNRRKDK